MKIMAQLMWTVLILLLEKLDGQKEKEGTPTMGGVIIIFSTIFPVLLLAHLNNIYIILTVVRLSFQFHYFSKNT